MPTLKKSQNLFQDFLKTTQRLQNKPCFQHKKNGKWETVSWLEAEEEIKKIALGLQVLGVKKGDMVALFSSTRMEWTLCDLAILSLGAVTVPIYQSSTSEQVSYIIQNSGSRFVFIENNNLYQKIHSELAQLPQLEKIIFLSGKVERHDMTLTLEQLQKLGNEGDDVVWKKGIADILPTQIATLVYTSGTTGPPKGAILTHGNFLNEIDACLQLFQIEEHQVTILFLPLAHIFARVMQFFHVRGGFTQAYAESIDKLVDNLGEVKPYFFVAVPRIFEKVYERILQQVEAGSPLKKAIFTWATAVGREMSLRKQKKKWISPVLTAQGMLASQLVFKKLRNRLGGRVRYTVSGGAPLSKDIAEFFHCAGIMIMEGYGLTETTAAVNCNTMDHYKFGTVGRRVGCMEEKIALDGEILVRGPLVFQGYYKDIEATKQVLSEDGWFKTGDIGEIDADGFLQITDRKKDIIVTAGGKNIAPQNIENVLKQVPFISQAVVLGDRRKYLTSLITLSKESVEDYAHKSSIAFGDYKELTHHPKIYDLIKKAIDEKNKILASYESIKRFAILENDFSQETGELTPTLKVKRKFVGEKYREVIDQLYQE